jgi:hypothetical protein
MKRYLLSEIELGVEEFGVHFQNGQVHNFKGKLEIIV